MELSGEALAKFFVTVLPVLGERDRPVVTGPLSVALGRGGQVECRGVFGQVSLRRTHLYTHTLVTRQPSCHDETVTGWLLQDDPVIMTGPLQPPVEPAVSPRADRCHQASRLTR